MTQADGAALIMAVLFMFCIILPVMYAILWVIEAAVAAASNAIDRWFVKLYLKILITDLDVYISVMSSVPVVYTNHILDVEDDSVVFKSTQSAAPPGEYCVATVKAPVALFTSPTCSEPHITVLKRKFFPECARLSRETRIGSRTFKWASLKVVQLDIQSGPVQEWKRFIYF